MISRKFSCASEGRITDFMLESESQKEDDSILDSIESVSDLWVMANMNETYDHEICNEEDNLHHSVTDTNPDVCSPD